MWSRSQTTQFILVVGEFVDGGSGFDSEDFDLRFEFADTALAVFSEVGVGEVGTAVGAGLRERVGGCWFSRRDSAAVLKGTEGCCGGGGGSCGGCGCLGKGGLQHSYGGHVMIDRTSID